MSSAPPAGGPVTPSERAIDPSDPALAAAVRIQRRRRRWAVATMWLVVALFLCAGVNSTANQNGTPSPTWFVGLTIACVVGIVVAACVAIGYSAALRRKPAPVRAEAIRLERQRLRQLWRYGWAGRLYHVFFWTSAWLGMALFLGCAVIGAPWAINGAAYLVGAGPVVRWAAALPVHNDGDAVGSLLIGLLFVFGGVMVVFFIYRRVTRRWWPRYLQRRARQLSLAVVCGRLRSLAVVSCRRGGWRARRPGSGCRRRRPCSRGRQATAP